MTQKTNNFFKDDTYSKQPKKNCLTNKTDVYYFGDIWSLDILDIKDYDPEHNRGHRYVLVVIDIFSNFSVAS